jgi:hypothetical protein
MAQPVQPPADPFAPYEPSDRQPWNVKRIGHLMRRAGFGLTDDWLESLLPAGPEEAVAVLTEYDPEDDPLNELIERLEGYLVFVEPRSVQGWWVWRMLNTTRPLQEKIALFWHDHFATSQVKVNNVRFMHNQIELFRHKGLGSFRQLLNDITADPAMLIWLDGNTNRKGNPNENYAREIMELFVLGIGSYSERDVKELARCFTGWQIQGEKGVLNPGLHDDGEKLVFGQRGRFDASTAIDILLEQPPAPRFLARNLLKEFVHPQPLDAHVEHYAKRIVENNWEIKPVLQEILRSRLFFSDWAYRSKIKSPIELCVGAVAALGGKVNTGYVRDSAAKMGQELLFPPNVKGWDGQENWINANTVLLRFNYGLALATQRNNEFARPSDLAKWIKRHNIETAEDVVEHLSRLLLDGEISEENRQKFVRYMKHDGKEEVRRFAITPGTINSKVRGLIHLLMSTPEYQLS